MMKKKYIILQIKVLCNYNRLYKVYFSNDNYSGYVTVVISIMHHH